LNALLYGFNGVNACVADWIGNAVTGSFEGMACVGCFDGFDEDVVH
jgi:hypothetical protein